MSGVNPMKKISIVKEMVIISQKAGFEKKENIKIAAIFLSPALILYLFLFIYPSIQAFYISLFDWNGFTASMNFIGLRNFKELFQDFRFWDVAVVNTVKYIFFGGILVFLCAFVLSGILSTKMRGRDFFRGLVFFPSIINPIAVCILWTFLVDRRVGLVNNLLDAVGLGMLKQTWMAPDYIFWTILVVLAWMHAGYYSVILLAAFDRVPLELIESANLEGASEINIFFKIKIPLIWDVFVVTMILWGITAIKQFSILFAFGGPGGSTPEALTNVAVAVYLTAFGKGLSINRMGYSTAMGIIMFMMVMILVTLISRVSRKENIEY